MAPPPPKIPHKSKQIDTPIPKLDPARVVTLLMARFGASESPPTEDDQKVFKKMLKLFPLNLRKGLSNKKFKISVPKKVFTKQKSLNVKSTTSQDPSTSNDPVIVTVNFEDKLCDDQPASPFSDVPNSGPNSPNAGPSSPLPPPPPSPPPHSMTDPYAIKYYASINKAYRYWTKQSPDTSVPLIIREHTNKNAKSRRQVPAVINKNPTVNDYQLRHHHRMLSTPNAGPVLQKIDDYVFEAIQRFPEDQILKQQMLVDWSNEAYDLFDPKKKIVPWFKNNIAWVDMFKRKFMINLEERNRNLPGYRAPEKINEKKTTVERLLDEAKKLVGDELVANLEPETENPDLDSSELEIRASKRKRAPPPKRIDSDLEDLSFTESEGEEDDLDSDDSEYDPYGPYEEEEPREVPFPVQALRNIYQYAYERFQEVHTKGEVIIRDKLIQEWGREAMVKFDPEQKTKFRASKCWVKKFKRRYGIVLKEIYNRPRNPDSRYYKEKERKKSKKENAEKETQVALASMDNSKGTASDLNHEPIDFDYLEHCQVDIHETSMLHIRNDTLAQVVHSSGISGTSSGRDSLLQQQLATAQEQIASYKAQIAAYQQLFATTTLAPQSNGQLPQSYHQVVHHVQPQQHSAVANNSLFYTHHHH